MRKMNEMKLVPLLPFNIPWKDYTRMFEEKPPERLGIVINTIAIGSLGPIDPKLLTQRLSDGIKNVLLVPENPLDQPELRNQWGIRDLGWRIDEFSTITADEFPKSYRLQTAWLVDKIYLQLGFVERGKPASQIGIALAMLSYDELVEMHGSKEPADQEPVMVESVVSKIYNAWIGDQYATRSAVWCRGLLDIRTRWLVTLRAIAAGKDPYMAYDHFIAAGGKYFLDYPLLCP